MKPYILLVLVLTLSLTIQANIVLAEHEHLCEHFPTGVDFGQHVSEHAKVGHFNRDMNPGMHQGYSICVP